MWEKIGNRCVRCFAAGLVISVAACTSSSTVASLETLRLKVEITEYLVNEADLFSVGGPLHPYRSSPVEKGLSLEQFYVLKRAEDEGQCGIVQRMRLEGLQNLYPELRPLVEDDKTGPAISVDFGSLRHNSIVRCYAHVKRLRYQQTIEQSAPLITLPLDADIFWDIHNERPDPVLDGYEMAFYELGVLAYCEEYVPAILDLLGPGVIPDRLALEPADELFLRQRLNSLAEDALKIFYYVPEGYSTKRVNILMDSLSSEEHVAVHRAALFGSVRDLDNSYWAGECTRLDELGL